MRNRYAYFLADGEYNVVLKKNYEVSIPILHSKNRLKKSSVKLDKSTTKLDNLTSEKKQSTMKLDKSTAKLDIFFVYLITQA